MGFLGDLRKLATDATEFAEAVKGVLAFLPLAAAGASLSVVLALWHRPEAIFLIFPTAKGLLFLGSLPLWETVVGGFVVLAVITAGRRAQHRIKLGVEAAQPSVLAQRRAEKFIRWIGELNQNELSALERIAEFGRIHHESALDSMWKGSGGILEIEALTKIVAAPSYRPLVDLWFSGSASKRLLSHV